jgi:hypothetical protein
MARIRTVKPEFWPDEKLSVQVALARLVALGLISMADDVGRLHDNVKIIDAFIFPNTDETSREAIASLSAAGFIIRGRTSSGQKVIQIANWHKHQKVDHPNLKACLPEIVEADDDTPIRDPLANDSRSVTDGFATRPTTNDQRPTTNERETIAASAAAPTPSVKIKDSSLQELDTFANTAWNALPRAIRGPDVSNPPSAAAMQAWKRRNSNAELRRLTADAGAVREAINQSPFLHGKGFFDFEWLFKSKDGQLNLQKVFNGNYRDKAQPTASTNGNAVSRIAVPDATAALLKSRTQVIAAGASPPEVHEANPQGQGTHPPAVAADH